MDKLTEKKYLERLHEKALVKVKEFSEHRREGHSDAGLSAYGMYLGYRSSIDTYLTLVYFREKATYQKMYNRYIAPLENIEADVWSREVEIRDNDI